MNINSEKMDPLYAKKKTKQTYQINESKYWKDESLISKKKKKKKTQQTHQIKENKFWKEGLLIRKTTKKKQKKKKHIK